MNICVNARDALLTSGMVAGIGAETDHTGGLINIQTFNTFLDDERSSRFFTAQPGEYVGIRISDNGVGMRAEVMERLFEPFYTTKGEKRGTGLGLAVAYGIVRQHNGFIDVISKLGTGSSFEILIPAMKETVEHEAKDPEFGLASGKGTILLIDDEPQVRSMTVRTLESCGYSVLQAENGVQAVALYEKKMKGIDLVVLDMIMPEMGGWECFRRVMEMKPKERVLVITGYTADRSAQDFLREGAMGVIEKPFSLHAFTEAVRLCLKG